MKVKITYTLTDNPNMQLEDLLNWPDISTLEEVKPYVTVYLDQKYGSGSYQIVSIEATV